MALLLLNFAAADCGPGYRTSVSSPGQTVRLPIKREADVAQAKCFHSLLAERRAELCDHLDEQAVKLARCERSGDIVTLARNRQRIKDIGAEIRDIDRMLHSLQVRLLAVQRKQRSG